MNRTWKWAQLLAGIFTLVLGIIAFAWPEATLHVVGFLFGLNLLIGGLSRTALLFFSSGYPMFNRVLGIIFSVLVAVIGILCLRNIAGSLKLLLVIVAIGWLLDGLAEIFMSFGSGGSGNGWRIGFGLVAVLAAIALLVWPNIGLAAFVFFGATTLCLLGLCLIFVAVAGLRSHSTESPAHHEAADLTAPSPTA
ncbi:HdeD family acid-resistance protein [Actinoplanes sp. GCM10030250]|uniref:HdeD family acid-resistance protein n=1 Tax=Actinoplanes sp. GCM10030250 TaxID=3273376 RepID=UPI003619C749